MEEKKEPTLYLIPTPIGNFDDITLRALKTLETVDLILCEDTRETGKLLHHYQIKNKLISCHEYNEDTMKNTVLGYLERGLTVGLVTDQGTPIISDPGYKIVEFVAQYDYTIISLPGPTAFVPALTLSALAPQPFLFYGFLNAKKGKRQTELKTLQNYPFTIIFYEAPHRIIETLNDMKELLGNRKVALVREISKKYEQVYRGTISSVLEQDIIIKGEMVLVIEGAEKIEYPFSIYDHINLFLEDGMSPNEAIKKVAKERNTPKSEVYKEYHINKQEGD